MPEAKAKAKLSPNQKLKEQEKKERRRRAGTTAALYGGGFALPALATWLLARRVNTAGFSPRQKLMAQLARKGKLGIRVDPGESTARSKWKNWIQFGGATPVEGGKALPSNVKAVYAPDVSYNPLDRGWKRKGVVPLELPNKAINPLKKDEKAIEAEFFKKYAPSSIPKSVAFLKGVKLHGTLSERAVQLRAILDSRLGKKWVLKHSKDFQSAGTLVTNKTNFERLIQKYQHLKANQPVPGIGLSSRQLRQIERTDPQGFIDYMNNRHGYQQFDRIKRILKNPKIGLGQQKEELQFPPIAPRRTWLKQQINKVLPERMQMDDTQYIHAEPKEYRMHVVGGHVTGATSPRHAANTLGDYFDIVSPVQRPEYRRMHEFVRKTLKKLPRGAREQSYGLDVVPLANGKFKIMEANPLSVSGFLQTGHPEPGQVDWGHGWNLHRAMGAVQGRATPLIAGTAATAAGLAGVAGVGGYDAIRAMAQARQRHKDQAFKARLKRVSPSPSSPSVA
jgi:hypothetical protein